MGIFRRGDQAAAAHLEDFHLWGQRGWAGFPIFGESHHAREIVAAFKAAGGGRSDEVTTVVELRPDPSNKYDPNAVEVRTASGVLGFLAKDAATAYAPILQALVSSGRRPLVGARIWVSPDDPAYCSVSLDLAAPGLLAPVNPEPQVQHVLLPTGSPIQVTGEENYLPTLRRYISASSECMAYATLHVVEVAAARTTKSVVEVRLDGDTVGILSPKMSTDLRPAVEYLAERGHVPACQAVVKGNALKVEVGLWVARAHELSNEWLAGIPDLRRVAAAAEEQATATLVPEPAASTFPPPPTPTEIPANWYPDPHGVARLRWWDGNAWTEHVAE